MRVLGGFSMSTSLTCWFLKEASVSELLMRILRHLSEISRGGGRGVETEGRSQLFETAEKGGVMKNGLLNG